MANQENKSTPLSGYKQSRKKLTPPMATIPNFSTCSWVNERLPEMLWAILIRDHHPGNTGYTILRDIMSWLAENKEDNELAGVTNTDISNLPIELRQGFIEHIVEVAGTDALRPLLLLETLPAYDIWKKAIGDIENNPEETWSQLVDAVGLVFFHQSQEATDVRWIKLMGTILAGKIRFPNSMKENIEDFNHYPNKGDQRSVRPSIRSMEMMDNLQDDKYTWASEFWDFVYENTLCIPEVNEHNKNEVFQKYEDVGKDKKYYASTTKDIWQKLIDHFYETLSTTTVDARHEAVFGLALYALNSFIQNNILLGASTPTGRVTARMIFETYITLSYLTKKENDGEALWETYREYGVGQISLVERKYADEDYKSAMVDPKIMDKIANEDKWSEFVPINLGNWDDSNLRKICKEVGEKEMYDKYYTYTSGYIHANWGAIRESTFQTCFNSLHRLHRIPSYGLPILSNVNEDCREMLNKIFGLVGQLYPNFDQQINKPSQKKTKGTNKTGVKKNDAVYFH